MKIKFKKMHGAGNDFVVMTDSSALPKDLSTLAISMCDRHFGIGADGLMLAASSKASDVKMVFYNADGSVAEMCGNGVRCFSKYVYEEGIVSKSEFDVETLAGIQHINLTEKDGEVVSVRVVMGKPRLNPKDVPVQTQKTEFVDQPAQIEGEEVLLTSMRVGVPHTMIFNENFDSRTVTELGPIVEKHDYFPEKTNVNFVEVISESELRLATWERGAGATLACGTGACASFYAAYAKGLVKDVVDVHVPGGCLKISLNAKDEIIMEGNAVLVAEGYYYYK